jgi:Tfp pilus assembly protein PilP
MRFAKTWLFTCGAMLVLGTLAGEVTHGQAAEGSQAKDQTAGADSVAGSQRGRRDPFQALIRKQAGTGQAMPDRLPAGKAGIVVSTMSVDGVVRSSSGMIAVVSTPQRRVYFVREGDRLYDGVVERITLDGMVVRERGQDAFGKPIDRLVTKRLYPSAGEGQ